MPRTRGFGMARRQEAPRYETRDYLTQLAVAQLLNEKPGYGLLIDPEDMGGGIEDMDPAMLLELLEEYEDEIRAALSGT